VVDVVCAGEVDAIRQCIDLTMTDGDSYCIALVQYCICMQFACWPISAVRIGQ